MPDRRPDPEELLARVQAEETRRRRGKLKVFFGAAPGVGKTYAMLEVARSRRAEGADVVIGWVETHGRAETERLLEGLERLLPRELSYRGQRLFEFDLDAALERRPTLVVVDELAHTNAAGSRHTKRWRDIVELLDAGIDVFTTVNVQHLESLNDVVASITGVVMRETVPDSVFDEAEEVELIDLPPDELLKRLREGKVYHAEMAATAAENFFRMGNLLALRELALRRTAERVNAQVVRYRDEHAIREPWPTAERVLVCVGPSPYAERLVRAARLLAASLRASLTAVYVEKPSQERPQVADRQQLERALALAERLGAETFTLIGEDPAEELLEFARRRNITKIVIGKPPRRGWRTLWGESFVDRLIRASARIDVYVIAGVEQPAARPMRQARVRRSWTGYIAGAAAVAAATALASLLRHFLVHPTNLVMVFLLAVVFVATRYGAGPSVFVSLLSVGAFDFFFVPPHLSFAVADTQYLLTFLTMLLVAVLLSRLTTRVRAQAERTSERERHTAALYTMSRELVRAVGREGVLSVAAQVVRDQLDCQVALFTAEPGGAVALRVALEAAFADSANERGVAQWVADHGRPAGLGTETLPGSQALYLPLLATRGTVGVLGVRPRTAAGTGVEQYHLLETFANQVAFALERVELASEAQEAHIQVEAERLRNVLLSSVSHDLRTPLAAIAGSATALLESEALGTVTRTELARTISSEAERLSRMIGNLLQVTRLESGAVQIEKELQPIDEALGAALTQVEPVLGGRAINVRLPESLPPVPVDGLLLDQVFTNLLENAARHTPPDTPIDVSAWPDGAWLVVEVADRGPGLEAGEEQRVFEKFYRARGGMAPTGSGLGLTICRGIVAAHGGTIWAENRPGGGVAFRFRLPLQESMTPASGPGRPED